MFHHRSCGTAQLVALMAAHRALRDDPAGLHQQEITRLTEALEARPQGWRRARPQPRRAAAAALFQARQAQGG